MLLTEDKLLFLNGKFFSFVLCVLVTTVIAIVVGLLVSGYYAVLAQSQDGASVTFDLTSYAGSGDAYNSLLVSPPSPHFFFEKTIHPFFSLINITLFYFHFPKWASLFGCVVSMVLYRIQGIMTFEVSMNTLVDGVRSIVEPILTLILAWSVGSAVSKLGTTDFIVSSLRGSLPVGAVPALVFISSCLISFCTGTSWGTMVRFFVWRGGGGFCCFGYCFDMYVVDIDTNHDINCSYSLYFGQIVSHVPSRCPSCCQTRRRPWPNRCHHQ